MDLSNKKIENYYYKGIHFIIVMIAVAVFAFIMKYYIFAAVELALAIILFVINVVSGKNSEKKIRDMFEKMAVNIGNATRSSLINFPLPTLVLASDGEIKWYNDRLKDIFGEEILFGKKINEIIPGFEAEPLFQNQSNMLTDISLKGRIFQVAGSKTAEQGSEKSDICVLYFYETTEAEQIKEKYINEKTFECLLFIDNYDEIMETTKNANMPQLQAQIYRVINDWVTENEGMLVKYEKDKYCIIFEYRKLEGFIKNKFDILNKVKDISEGNSVPATISIGIGLNGATIAENDDFAKVAINMALGRGGDQVVIKDSEQFRFYGGASKEYERSTRVKARVVSFALSGLIESAADVMIMGHKNSDIDSLGASFGIYRMCKMHNKPVNIILETYNQTVKSMISRLEAANEYAGIFINAQQALAKITPNTLLIVVDTHRKALAESLPLLDRAQQRVVIDHHRRGADFIDNTALVYHEPYSSSTCEMVTEILQYTKDKMSLTKLEAECLYAGIVLDTKNFTFKTGVRTFEAASYLRKQGVDTVAIKMMFQQDLTSYTKKSQIIKNAEIIKEHIAIGIYDKIEKDVDVLAAQTADEFLNIKGIMASFVLCRTETGVSISGRSLGSINVQVILEKLGGGGHLTIAGAQIENITPGEALEKLKTAIESYYDENSN